MAWAGVLMVLPFCRANRGHALVSSVLTGHKLMHMPTYEDQFHFVRRDIEWPMLRAVFAMADICPQPSEAKELESSCGWSFNLSSFVDTVFFQHETAAK